MHTQISRLKLLQLLQIIYYLQMSTFQVEFSMYIKGHLLPKTLILKGGFRLNLRAILKNLYFFGLRG